MSTPEKDEAAILMRAAGDFGAAALNSYREQTPQMFEGLAKLFAGGFAEFDVIVRGVTGGAPLLELYVRTNAGSELIASQQLTRRDAKPAAWLLN